MCVASGAATSGTNMVCVDGVSAACGSPSGAPCCADNTCATGRCCVDGKCVQRGGVKSCGGSLGTCNNGSCGTCGGNLQACCAGAPGGVGVAASFCTASGLACNPATSLCATCGGNGQPCCDGNVCSTGGCCDHNTRICVQAGSACSGGQGTCTGGGCQLGACGKLGESCCAGGVACTAPFATCSGECAFRAGAPGKTAAPARCAPWAPARLSIPVLEARGLSRQQPHREHETADPGERGRAQGAPPGQEYKP